MSASEVRAKFLPRLPHTINEVFPTALPLEFDQSGVLPALKWLAETIRSGKAAKNFVAPVSLPSKAPTLDSPLEGKLESFLTRSITDEISDPAKFLQHFHNIDLPSWDHYTHIRLAFIVLTTYGRQKGISQSTCCSYSD